MHVVVERREEDGEINQQIWLHKRQEEMKEERCNDVKEKNKNKKHFTKKQKQHIYDYKTTRNKFYYLLPSSDRKKQNTHCLKKIYEKKI